MTNIEKGIAPPPEKKRTPRARKPKAEQSSAASLIRALQFVSMAQKDAGTNYQTHCIINNHWCVAFDGLLMIGCKVEEDISACPNTSKLLTALQKCGAQIAITQLTENAIDVKSDKFKAKIDCVSLDQMPLSSPDPFAGPITDAVKAACGALAWLATEGATQPFKAGVYVKAGSAVATSGMVLLEYWHACNMPELLLPKRTAEVLSRIDRKLVGFGFSQTSVTFYFEDESFIKSQLLDDRFPEYEKLFDGFSGMSSVPVSPDFFKAVESIAPFAEQKIAWFRGNRLQSHKVDDLGASHECEGMPNIDGCNVEFLKACQPHFHNVIFGNGSLMFSNGMVRGCIAYAR